MSSFSRGPCAVCIFCYKTAIVSSNYCTTKFGIIDSDTGADYTAIVVKRFLTILDRYTCGKRGSISKDIKNLSKCLNCCEECLELVDEFCSAYHEMMKLELQLDWRLERLAKIMELAGRVPSRWHKLQKLVARNISRTGPEFGYSETQEENDTRLSAIRSFRHNVMKKCSRRLSKLLPRVVITDNAQNYSTTALCHDTVQNPMTDSMINLWSGLREPEETSDAVSKADELEAPEEPNSSAYTDSCSNSTGTDTATNGPSTTITSIIVKFEPHSNQQEEPISTSQSYNFTGNGYSSLVETEDGEESYSYFEYLTPDKDPLAYQSDNEESDSITTEQKSRNTGQSNNGRKFGCSKCDSSFHTRDRLISHLNKVHVARTHKCLECPKSFKLAKQLEKHSIVHKGPSSWKFKCSICEKPYRFEYDLTNHMGRAHGQGTQIPCPNCSRTFYTNESLYKHKLVVHSGISYKCPNCDKSYCAKNKLRQHIRRFHNGSDSVSPSSSVRTARKKQIKSER